MTVITMAPISTQSGVNTTTDTNFTVSNACAWNPAKTGLEVFFIATFLVNVFAAVVIWKVPMHSPGKRHERGSNLQLSVRVLNCLDILQGFFSSVMPLLILPDCNVIGGMSMCDVLGYLLTVLLVLSPYVVFVMAVDRCIAITNPMFYRYHYNFKMTAKILVGIFIFVLLQMAIPFWGVGRMMLYQGRGVCGLDMYSQDTGTIVITILYVGEGLLTIVGMVVIATICFICIRRHTETTAKPTAQTKSSERRNRRMNQINKMILGTSALYVLSYTPFIIRKFIEISQDNNYITQGPLASITFGIIFVNPLLNPIIYVSLIKSYSDQAKYIFCCMACRKKSMDKNERRKSEVSISTLSSGLHQSIVTRQLSLTQEDVAGASPI